MRRLSVLALAAVLIVGLAAPAYAGDRHHRHDRHDSGSNTTANVALGLAGLALFNQMAGVLTDHRSRSRTIVYERQVYVAPAPVIYERRVYAAPTVIYETAPAVIVASPPPPPPAPPQTVYYPHGRYEFAGQQWVWIPNAPTPPPPAPPELKRGEPPTAESCQQTGKWVKTPYGFQPECR